MGLQYNTQTADADSYVGGYDESYSVSYIRNIWERGIGEVDLTTGTVGELSRSLALPAVLVLLALAKRDMLTRLFWVSIEGLISATLSAPTSPFLGPYLFFSGFPLPPRWCTLHRRFPSPIRATTTAIPP
jgi:hypothetical protein